MNVFDLQTATSALWVLYNLARHPEVQENLYKEVTSVLGKDGDVTPGSLAKLSYLKACVKESARRVLCETVFVKGKWRTTWLSEALLKTLK